jgi:hypothetical protein
LTFPHKRIRALPPPQSGGKATRALSAAALTAITELLNDAAELFAEFGVTFTPADRERLLSVGLKNLGFIQTAYTQAQANPALVPGYLDMYVKTAARQRVNGAEPVYALLKPYFKRSRPGAAEPTEQQIERDVRGLLSGAKEGRVTIENENPDTTGGHRRVVDEVHPADVRTEATGYVRADHRAEEPGRT